MRISGISNLNNYGAARQNFKAQSEPVQDLGIKENKEENNASIPIETYKSYYTLNDGSLEQSCLTKTSESYLGEISSFVTKNNLNVDIETSPDNTLTNMRLLLIPEKELNCAPGTYEVLRVMTGLAEEDAYTSKPDYDIEEEENGIRVLCEDTSAVDTIETVLNSVFYPDNFTEEKLKTAKSYITDAMSESDYAYGPEILTNESKKFSVSDIEKVTLDDVKNLHNEIIENSAAKAAISLPSDSYNENKDKIAQLLDNTPTVQPYDINSIYKPVKPIETTKTINLKSGDTFGAERLYNADTNSLKDEIMLDLLIDYMNNKHGQKAKECSQNTGNLLSGYLNGNQNESEFYAGNTTCKWNDCLYVSNHVFDSDESKKYDTANVEPMKKYLADFIEEIKTEPFDKAVFENTKETLVNIKSEPLMETEKTNYLCNMYSNGDYNDYMNTLQSITSEEVQNYANKILSKPYIETVRTQ